MIAMVYAVINTFYSEFINYQCVIFTIWIVSATKPVLNRINRRLFTVIVVLWLSFFNPVEIAQIMVFWMSYVSGVYAIV